MKNVRKYICILVLGCVLCTNVYNVYQTCYASELVVAGGLASAGTALLGLLAMAGVGMELENNHKFNELSEEEKTRIENGLAQNYNEVALQRGASLEKIKNWTSELCSGVLDKTSECWGIFKDWAKSIDIQSISNKNPALDYEVGHIPLYIGMPFTITDTSNNFTATISTSDVLSMGSFNFNREYDLVAYYWGKGNAYPYRIYALTCKKNANNTYDTTRIPICEVNVKGVVMSIGGNTSTTTNDYFNPQYWTNNLNGFVCYGNADIPMRLNGLIVDNSNDYGQLGASTSIFKTNTDYLERLKGQEEDVIDVIDVTDIKNPIVESRGNSIANINWNRGTRRTDNNNDDDNKMVTGLVPMDVWYEAIDDEQEEMKDAVVVYDNYIKNHPDEQGKYFISTTPITNINNYYNTLPVVNIPATGTVVNNYYEYNNYNNHNVTIYQDPYNAGIIPTFPDFSKKFPFCIPFDLYEFFAVFLAEKEAPKIDIPFPVLDNTQHQLSVEYITIDLAPYEYVSDVLRVMLFIAFCVGLMLLTRHLIKG